VIWLRILGRPARQFYRDARALPHLAIGEARHELLTSLGTLRSGVDGEAPGVTVTLRNDGGQCARLFALPPIAAPAELRDATGVVFAGTVRTIDLSGGECRIGIEA
jgi:hypothetical protein